MPLVSAVLLSVLVASAIARTDPAQTDPARTALQHSIEARLDVPAHTIQVRDEITLDPELMNESAGPPEVLRFLLHRDLKIRSARVNGREVAVEASEGWNPRHFWDRPPYAELEGFEIAREYTVPVVHDRRGDIIQKTIRLELEYGGIIADSLHAPDVAYGRSFETTSGRIVEQGAYLAGSTFWVPWFGDRLISFALTADVPADWKVVSQGIPAEDVEPSREKGRSRMAWLSDAPVEEVFLIAGPYRVREAEHTVQNRQVRVMTFCYENTGDDITDRYIEGTKRYLDQYSMRFGPYPFQKFALVENYWQSGYGMPSFTLLGDKVIRLPFILDTSFGHEILHNWWGNGVYVKEEEGNWCEGLTTYCADYAAKEKEGDAAAADYRRGALLGYRDFAAKGGKDFPLVKFRERDSAATQAVGYGKTMMVFHMLREKIGSETFDAALRAFRDKHLFQESSWGDLRAAFEEQSKMNLQSWFEQWIERPGAPSLTIENVRSSRKKGSITGTIRQSSPEYALEVPLRVLAKGDTTWTRVELNGPKTDFTIPVKASPSEVAVDPEFDLFRILHEEEIAPALSGVLGAERTRFILGADSSPELQEALRSAIQEWNPDSTSCVTLEGEGKCENWDGATWVLGPGPLARKLLEGAAKSTPVEGAKGSIVIATTLESGEARRPAALLLPENAEVAAAIARKIPHYSKYSYLVFEGTTNVAKGMWEAGDSPLRVVLDGKGKGVSK